MEKLSTLGIGLVITAKTQIEAGKDTYESDDENRNITQFMSS
jgi:hypothetical protein